MTNSISLPSLALLAGALLALAACDPFESTASSTSSGGGSGGQAATTSGGGGDAGQPDAAPAGPVVRIHMRANTKPFPHADGLAGQTPIAHSSGMRKFQLFKDASDPSPITVFDYGTGFVEAGYDDGDDTVVATVPIKSLTAGVYTMGRVVHSHVRYTIAATVHVNGVSLPGTFDNVQVMSDGTLLDGVLRNHGHYDYKFHAAGQTFPLTGENAPEPVYAGSGGFGVKLEKGEWAYYFPLSLPVTPDLASDVDVVMEVNMFESFRWQDQDGPGNTTGAFDVSATAIEPVLQFGANSFAVHAE